MSFGLNRLDKRLRETAFNEPEQPLRAALHRDQLWLVVRLFGEELVVESDFMDDDDGVEHFVVSVFSSHERVMEHIAASPFRALGTRKTYVCRRLSETASTGIACFMSEVMHAVKVYSSVPVFKEHRASLEEGKIWVVINPSWEGVNISGLHIPLEEFFKVWGPLEDGVDADADADADARMRKMFYGALVELLK